MARLYRATRNLASRPAGPPRGAGGRNRIDRGDGAGGEDEDQNQVFRSSMGASQVSMGAL